ncbi:MAG: alpha/beta hydrolase [Candidatus Accumulibacter sp.]|jgi:alpha/beta superfamily hydrolase|nr:alpha/beta hydrolase [Accumulibacter sp.]
MRPTEQLLLIDGPAGAIETRVESPAEPCGLALVCHPHPLFGGSRENKVARTLASTFVRLNHAVLRPNFRGVGASGGEHDHGRGETEDMLIVLDEARRIFGELPVILAGYSFGAYVQTRVAEALAGSGQPARRLVLVAAATGHVEGISRPYAARPVGGDTLLIHGSADTTVPLTNVLAWAEALELPVIVIPGADHFFHRRQHIIRDIVLRAWECPLTTRRA